jgi:hypothetical protein
VISPNASSRSRKRWVLSFVVIMSGGRATVRDRRPTVARGAGPARGAVPEPRTRRSEAKDPLPYSGIERSCGRLGFRSADGRANPCRDRSAARDQRTRAVRRLRPGLCNDHDSPSQDRTGANCAHGPHSRSLRQRDRILVTPKLHRIGLRKASNPFERKSVASCTAAGRLIAGPTHTRSGGPSARVTV